MYNTIFHDSGAIYTAIIGGVISLLLWFINKEKERNIRDRLHREEIYKGLIETLPGFFENSHLSKEEEVEQKANFIYHYQLMTLYCPDEIYYKAKEFLDSVETNTVTGDAKENTIRELILLLRKDLTKGKRIKATKLKIEDIIFFNVKV